jgi:HlyD family secretion protein
MPTDLSNNGTIPSSMQDVMSRRSELMHEIVSDRPGFIIRWGNILFLSVLILIVTACWFIRYPDIIKASAKMTSLNAPKPVVALVSGKLVKLTVRENETVNKGQIIGHLESIGDHKKILALSSNLDSIQNFLSTEQTDRVKSYFKIMAPSQLGELQIGYQTFSQAFLSFNNYLSNGFYLRKKDILMRDKKNLLKLYDNLNTQKELQEQDVALTQKTFDANQSLKNNNVISDFDYRTEQSKLINKKLTLPQIKSMLIENENQQAQKEKEIIELENTIEQQKLIFQQALNTFRSEVEEWKKKYILIAPVSGKVAFSSFIQEDQQMQANDVVCYINPENSHYFAEVIIPQSNFGKVAVGQQVLLKFQSYPFEEYGAVKGTIEFISHIPTKEGYVAKVGLPNGLITTRGERVQYREGLLADAEVITHDMRLLERFYYSIYGNINR